MSETTRRVVCAAMLMDDGTVVTGVRHFSPDMRATLERIYGKRRLKVFSWWLIKPYHLRVKEHGFVDAKGVFMTREEAWERADKHGQIFTYDPMDSGKLTAEPANQGTAGMLFSENLY